MSYLETNIFFFLIALLPIWILVIILIRIFSKEYRGVQKENPPNPPQPDSELNDINYLLQKNIELNGENQNLLKRIKILEELNDSFVQKNEPEKQIDKINSLFHEYCTEMKINKKYTTLVDFEKFIVWSIQRDCDKTLIKLL